RLVAGKLGKTMRPDKIHTVPALAKTRSGKIVRKTIRCTYLGEDAGDKSSIENPEALEHISGLNL
ncbi:MAG TPA: hypothetical protein PKC98_17260, partial [Candidatus Melainabacteria bacterium]|nr:hypothetical protein [Candidatus Melainabacteria bacterium]